MRGSTCIIITVEHGIVCSCKAVGQHEQVQELAVEALTAQDNRESFHWEFHPALSPISASQVQIPRRQVRQLDLRRLQSLSKEEQQDVLTLFMHVNGRDALPTLQQKVQLRKLSFEKGIALLQELKAISF
jgi:hypothetical protein